MDNDDSFQVRDKRANNRYFIDNVFLRGGWGAELGPHAIAVYNAVALHADNETQTAYPSHKKIANLTGMSHRQVPRELEKLAKYKIIHIESRAEQRKSSLITLLDESEWIPIEHMTGRHMTRSHMSESQQAYDSESYEHMTPCHTNNTHMNKTKGTKPNRGEKKSPKPPTPQAVQEFRKAAHRYPAKSWYDDISHIVGDNPDDLQFWHDVVKGYVGKGWNPTNVVGMLDYFKRREIPTDDKRNGANHESPNRKRSGSRIPDHFTDEHRAAIERLSRQFDEKT